MPRPTGHAINAAAFDDLLLLTGKSLTQVAKEAEVPRPTLSSLTCGHSRASVPLCHRIAAALGVSPVTLFPSLRPAPEAVS